MASKTLNQWIIAAAVACCMVLVFYQQLVKPAPQPGVGTAIGQKAPSFALEDLTSQTYTLESLRGKPAVINFWASWCGPCIEEAPSFVKLEQKHGSDLHIIAINLTTLDTTDKVQSFVQKYGYRFPVLLDKTGEAAAAYNIQPIPSTFFLNKDGVIVDGALGAIDPLTLEQKALALLSKP